MSKWADAAESLGKDSTPKKELSHILTRKSANGGHIHEHHHKHPEHHPREDHTTKGDDEMVEHLMAHMGQPNPGEDVSDAGSPAAGNTSPSAPAAGGAAPVQTAQIGL